MFCQFQKSEKFVNIKRTIQMHRSKAYQFIFLCCGENLSADAALETFYATKKSGLKLTNCNQMLKS